MSIRINWLVIADRVYPGLMKAAIEQRYEDVSLALYNYDHALQEAFK